MIYRDSHGIYWFVYRTCRIIIESIIFSWNPHAGHGITNILYNQYDFYWIRKEFHGNIKSFYGIYMIFNEPARLFKKKKNNICIESVGCSYNRQYFMESLWFEYNRNDFYWIGRILMESIELFIESLCLVLIHNDFARIILILMESLWFIRNL